VNISDATFLVVDVETTGLDPAKDQLVEIAAVATTFRGVVGMFATLVEPTIPIPPEVTAIHGITDAMVAGYPEAVNALTALEIFEATMRANVDVAHNRQFDAAFLGRSKVAGLCTRRLAQHLWPDAPNHRNQTLRYWRDLKFDDYGIQEHRALGDAIVTAALLRDILDDQPQIETVEQLQALSNAPILWKTWWFGKYYSQPIVPASGPDKDYIRWAFDKKDMDADQRYSLQEALKNAH
jgi:exodeoxyribonuclease X